MGNSFLSSLSLVTRTENVKMLDYADERRSKDPCKLNLSMPGGFSKLYFIPLFSKHIGTISSKKLLVLLRISITQDFHLIYIKIRLQ